MRWTRDHLQITLKSHIPSIWTLRKLWVLSKMFLPIQQRSVKPSLISWFIYVLQDRDAFDIRGPSSVVTKSFYFGFNIKLNSLCAIWKMKTSRELPVLISKQQTQSEHKLDFQNACIKLSNIYPQATCCFLIYFGPWAKLQLFLCTICVTLVSNSKAVQFSFWDFFFLERFSY